MSPKTALADERPLVAAVFVNRLEKGIPLASDPTIVYGLAQGKGTLGRSITKADLNQATPYNTYLIDGLPPGPIANPGLSAIKAALTPDDTPFLYFVAKADGSGGHTFSDSLEKHGVAVAQYRHATNRATKNH